MNPYFIATLDKTMQALSVMNGDLRYVVVVPRLVSGNNQIVLLALEDPEFWENVISGCESVQKAYFVIS